MDVNLGLFKYIFQLDSLYGLCTVSLTTLKQSKWKVAISAVYLLTCVVETGIVCHSHVTSHAFKFESNGMLFIKASALIHPMYSLIMAVRDYKSKISAALNLEAIGTKLKTQNIPVPGQGLFKASVWGLVIANIVLQLWGFVGNFLGTHTSFPLTKHLTTVHFIGTQLQQGAFPFIYFSKVAMIKRGIITGFSEIKQQQNAFSSTRNQRPSNRRRRSVELQRDLEKKWALLSELDGCLVTVENTIRGTSWVPIAFGRLFTEVFIAAGLVMSAKGSLLIRLDFVLTMLRFSVLFLGTVYAVEQLYSVKRQALPALYSVRGNQDQPCTSVKHQMLAAIHRHRTFSCRLFDVEYSLVATVLENMLFIYTTIVENTRRDT